MTHRAIIGEKRSSKIRALMPPLPLTPTLDDDYTPLVAQNTAERKTTTGVVPDQANADRTKESAMMRKHRLSFSLMFAAVLGLAASTSVPHPPTQSEGATIMNVDQIKLALVGDWVSIAPEIRPSASKNADGTLKPFYLRRNFKYLAGDRFELSVVNSADPNAAVPLAKIFIKGHMVWRGPHPIAAGAQKVDFVADEGYEVTPLIQGFADLLNQVAKNSYNPWVVNGTQSIFGKTFVPFGLVEGKNFMEFDLVYLYHDMLFWGARNIDGRGFDKEENRPTNLQIPLVRKLD